MRRRFQAARFLYPPTCESAASRFLRPNSPPSFIYTDLQAKISYYLFSIYRTLKR
nr:MAG TPA: hypothetical protein [Caudoviricetes sp.]